MKFNKSITIIAISIFLTASYSFTWTTSKSATVCQSSFQHFSRLCHTSKFVLSIVNNHKIMAAGFIAIGALISYTPTRTFIINNVKSWAATALKFLGLSFNNPGLLLWAVEHGANINYLDAHSKALLFHLAIERGRAATVSGLIRAGIGFNVLDSRNTTPLDHAISCRELEVARVLMRAGADIEARDAQGMTWLHASAAEGDMLRVQTLLNLGADSNSQDERGKRPLHYAAINGREGVVFVLAQGGANLNIQDNGLMTPMHCAASRGYLAVIRRLAYHGANANARRSSDFTPLHDASLNNQSEAVRVLITECQADVHACTIDHSTPLHVAASNGAAAAAQVLIQYGANMNAQNNILLTPLDNAIIKHEPDVARLLTRPGVITINARDAQGRTRLHWAALTWQWFALDCFLKAGADANAVANDNITPLHCAAWCGCEKTIQLLLGAGALINACDSGGRTPLHWAAARGNLAAVRLLLGAHADATARDGQGRTAAQLTTDQAIRDLLVNANNYEGAQ